ncbi:LytR/AlgR family response regulator transcription factor [Flavobacterium soyae]|uniref:LytTR family DNA-binding domain-containing protein n=1 Tax=Flavobacterium soyae TaxID=2903098 RepID=A0ABZ2UEX3_9FLAO|nr:LytTR family DNA-binding domain-containing protein [Flavobacterium soyae]MCD9575377.1 LytTR family DNA-binding domain-containing protein [Flavobacterium soyae]
MITAIALDDELPALEVLEAFCNQSKEVNLIKFFTKTQDARFYLEEYPIDLLFLDINMPSVSGIDFYKSISQQTTVIFTTAYAEYAAESYELNAVDYLMKPFSYDRFLKAIDKVKKLNQIQKADKQNYILFRVDYGLTKVLLSDILYIEGLDNYLKVHIKNQKTLVVRMTMKMLLEKLPSQEFCRVHRSYIVSLSYVQSYRNKIIKINDQDIPLGNNYETDFLQIFNDLSQ